MKQIEEIDRNLKVRTELQKEDIVFYDCLDSRFVINGLLLPKKEGDSFRRIPRETASRVNEGVAYLNSCTAGGRIRFKTDSKYVAIQAILVDVCKMSHMTFTGSIGFDLYEFREGKEIYTGSFVPPVDIADRYESIIEFEEERERELVINMPLYSGVEKLYIGLSENAAILNCHPYSHPIPVVYYGSSITQGGCASRPGNSYQSMISRKLDCDYVNLGFSGSARGEQSIAEYISRLPMSAFVYDYDYNAPDVEHLKKTHQKMFKIIRDANPKLPIVIVSMPDSSGRRAVDERFEIIQKTYDDAIRDNDTYVYLIDGRIIMSDIADGSGTVDGCHPNDLGFYTMAQRIGDVLFQVI